MAVQSCIRRFMVLKNGWFILILFALVSCGSDVQTGKSGERGSLPDGETLYLENCATCHGIDGTLGKAGSKDLTKTTLQVHELKKIVEVGTSNGMPRFKEILGGDAEVEAVVHYIMGFKRINE